MSANTDMSVRKVKTVYWMPHASGCTNWVDFVIVTEEGDTLELSCLGDNGMPQVIMGEPE